MKKVSDHILPTSSNLLGICFVIVSFLKANRLSNETLLDEVTLIPIFLFFVSSIFSYLSIRSEKEEKRFEKIADVAFFIGLSMLSITAFILTLKIIN